MFLFIGCIMAVVQGGYVRRVPAGKEKAMALKGLLLIVPSFAIVGFAYTVTQLYAGLALYALSTSICVPMMTTMVSSYGDASQKGIIMGVYRNSVVRLIV
jgi:ABC-type proline/glycine betaine transport system permease subunit